MNSSRFIFTFIISLLVALSFGSALASDCASIPMQSENGSYNGCEVVHGAEVLFRDAEDVPESECPKICEGLSEMDAMAAESQALDAEAGFTNK